MHDWEFLTIVSHSLIIASAVGAKVVMQLGPGSLGHWEGTDVEDMYKEN